MCKIVLGLAVAAAVAGTGSGFCSRSSEVSVNSEAVATTVRILPADILQSQIGIWLSR